MFHSLLDAYVAKAGNDGAGGRPNWPADCHVLFFERTGDYDYAKMLFG